MAPEDGTMAQDSTSQQLCILVLARGCLVECEDGGVGCDDRGAAQFINELASKGVHVILCSHLISKVHSAKVGRISPDVHVRILGSCTRWRYVSPRTAIRLIRAMRDADYLYLWTGTFAIYTATLNRWFAHKPFAVYEQDWTDDAYLRTYLVNQSALVRWLYPCIMRRFRNRLIRSASHVYVHGGKLREESRATRGGTVLDVVPLTPVHRRDFYQRDKADLSKGVRIAYVGGVGPKKGVEVLIEALHELKSRGVSFQFRSATKAPFLESQQKRLADLQLDNAMQLHVGLSWDPDLRELLRESDILVVSSFSEGFPRVIYEAGSQGLALVTTPVGGIPYALENDRDALFVAPGDSVGLADALECLARHPELVLWLGRNLQQTVWRLLFMSADFESHAEQVIYFAREYAQKEESCEKSCDRGMPAN